MIRIIVDIEEDADVMTTKEVVAMALEKLGSVRVVSVKGGRVFEATVTPKRML